MNNVSLVSLDMYHEHQYRGLVADYQRLIWADLATPIYLDAARIKWGCTGDDAQLAIYEAQEMS